MSTITYALLELELNHCELTGQPLDLKHIQAKYNIGAKRQLTNRLAKLEAAHKAGRSGADLDARRTVFRLSHDDLAARISAGATWAELGEAAGVKSTYAQAVWGSIQHKYPGVRYLHGKGRGRNGHPVTDEDRQTVFDFKVGNITRAQAYDRLTACGRSRGGAKQILNKHHDVVHSRSSLESSSMSSTASTSSTSHSPPLSRSSSVSPSESSAYTRSPSPPQRMALPISSLVTFAPAPAYENPPRLRVSAPLGVHVSKRPLGLAPISSERGGSADSEETLETPKPRPEQQKLEDEEMEVSDESDELEEEDE